MKNRRESCLGIFAIDTAALLRTSLSLLKALTVILLALRLGALAPPLHMRLVVMLDREYILTIEALAISPTDSSLGETLTILGLASRLGAFALDLAFHLGLLAVERQQVVDLPLGCIGSQVQKVIELRKSNL
jgi:hypothetical protein